VIVNEFHTAGGELRRPTVPTMCSRSTAALQPLRTAARDAEIAAGAPRRGGPSARGCGACRRRSSLCGHSGGSQFRPWI